MQYGVGFTVIKEIRNKNAELRPINDHITFLRVLGEPFNSSIRTASRAQVKDIISKGHNGKAPGKDGINMELMKP